MTDLRKAIDVDYFLLCVRAQLIRLIQTFLEFSSPYRNRPYKGVSIIVERNEAFIHSFIRYIFKHIWPAVQWRSLTRSQPRIDRFFIVCALPFPFNPIFFTGSHELLDSTSRFRSGSAVTYVHRSLLSLFPLPHFIVKIFPKHKHVGLGCLLSHFRYQRLNVLP